MWLFADEIGDYEEKFTEIINRYDREITFINSSQIVENFKNRGVPTVSGGYSSYIRLASYKYLSNLNRILYIDCDTLITSDISDIYDIYLGKQAVGAVADAITSYGNISLGFRRSELYFNAGVLLINLSWWRENNLLNKAVAALERLDLNKTATSSDQDLLNYILRGYVKKIPLRYNVLIPNRIYKASYLLYIIDKNEDSYYSKREIEEAVLKPGIIHFAGNILIRPWYKNSYDPLKEEWNRYFNILGWKEDFDMSANINLWRYLCICMLKFMPKPIYAFIKRYQEMFKHWKIMMFGR